MHSFELIDDTNPAVRCTVDAIRELVFKHYGEVMGFEQFLAETEFVLAGYKDTKDFSIDHHSLHLFRNTPANRLSLLRIALAYLADTRRTSDQYAVDRYIHDAERYIDLFNDAVQCELPQISKARAGGMASRSSNKLVRAKVIELIRTLRPRNGWASKSAAYRGILEPLQEFIADHNAKHPRDKIHLSTDNLERRLQEWSLEYEDITAVLRETMIHE